MLMKEVGKNGNGSPSEIEHWVEEVRASRWVTSPALCGVMWLFTVKPAVKTVADPVSVACLMAL